MRETDGDREPGFLVEPGRGGRCPDEPEPAPRVDAAGEPLFE